MRAPSRSAFSHSQHIAFHQSHIGDELASAAEILNRQTFSQQNQGTKDSPLKQILFLTLQHVLLERVLMSFRHRDSKPIALFLNNSVSEAGMRIRPLQHSGNSQYSWLLSVFVEPPKAKHAQYRSLPPFSRCAVKRCNCERESAHGSERPVRDAQFSRAKVGRAFTLAGRGR